MTEDRSIPRKIAVIYACVGAAWILFSDELVALLVHDPLLATRLSIAKGWFYVCVTALLLFWLVRRDLRHILTVQDELRQRNEELMMLEEEMRQQIEEYHHSEEELHRSNDAMTALFQASPLAIVAHDTSGTVTHWNRSAERLFGWRADEVLGRPCPLTPPGRGEECEKLLADVLAGRTLVNEEMLRQARGGELIDVSLSTGLFHDARGQVAGLIVVMADIRAGKQSQQALLASEARFRRLFEQAGDAIFVHDNAGRFMDVNELACTSLGYGREELLALTIADIEVNFTGDQLAELWEGMASGDRVSVFGRYRRRDGSRIPVEVKLARLEGGERKLFLAIARDVSEQMRAHEEIRRLNAELEQRVANRTAQLEAVVGELESFSYSVSHDLRAPLRHINGFGRALLEDYEDRFDGEGRLYLQRILAGTERMGHLIDDLLKLAQVTGGEFHRKEIDMSWLVRTVTQELQQGELQRQVEFTIEEGLATNGDPRLLRLALENLLGNALKYTRPRNQAIIEFGAVDHNGEPAFFVRDNGVGFDMSYADKLFGAFQRLHRGDEFEGTGIGLATVKRIIRRHGGEVWAESAVDQGATFFFTLGTNDRAKGGDHG